MTELDQKAFDTVKKLFKNDYGNPFEMTLGQIVLFRAIYEKQSPRVQAETYTQYGKSDIVSIATLMQATTFPEKWPILGGTKDKAKIIMGYVIKHIFENDYTLSKFTIGEGEKYERIKREKSKQRLTFKVDDEGNMGEVFILSADARRKGEDAGNILMGYGAPNLVMDDSPLCPDVIWGKALRMLGGHKENFCLKIGNTFNRNHFLRSHNNPKYKKITIDYHQGIKEGRVTPEYIEEMRQEIDDPVLFGILYECKFPGEEMIEEGKWMSLLTEKEVEDAQQRATEIQSTGIKKLGGDIGEGGNHNAFIIRTDNLAWVKEKNLERDLMKTADKIKDIKKDELLQDEDMFIDAVGVGAGVVSRLNQIKIIVNAIKGGAKSTEKTKIEQELDPIEFYNLRAEMYWKTRQWIKEGGALSPHKDWRQLAKTKYKIDHEKRIKIMSKEEMRRRGIESPDVGDALVLSFGPIIAPADYHPEATAPIKPYYPELGF